MWKKFNWFLPFLVGAYMATRLWGLASFPLFTDEVYYLRLVREAPNIFWASFADGKEPLFFWFLAFFSKYFSNPILTGRIFATLAGLGTIFLIYALGKELFNKRVGAIAAIFYLFSPFALIYNRLSILDSLVTFLLTAFFYFLIKAKDWRWTFFAGVAFGLSLLTKTVSQLYVFLIPLWGLSPRRRYVVVIILMAGVMYFLLTLVPGFSQIALKNQSFVYPIGFALTHLQKIFIANLKMSLKDWLLIYFGWSPLLGIFFAGIWGSLKKEKQVVFLLVTFLLPLLAECFIANIFFPRYLLFLLTPGFLLLGYWIDQAGIKPIFILLVLVFLVQPFWLFWQVELQPDRAALPVIEQWQFFTGWPSGLKAQKAIEDIRKLSLNKHIIVATQNYGVGEFIKYEFFNDPNVTIKTITNRSDKIQADYFALN